MEFIDFEALSTTFYHFSVLHFRYKNLQVIRFLFLKTILCFNVRVIPLYIIQCNKCGWRLRVDKITNRNSVFDSGNLS